MADDSAWAGPYGPRFDAHCVSKGDGARQHLAEQIGAESLRLMHVI